MTTELRTLNRGDLVDVYYEQNPTKRTYLKAKLLHFVSAISPITEIWYVEFVDSSKDNDFVYVSKRVD